MEQASEDVTFIDLPRRRRSRLSRVARSRRSAGTKVVALGVKLCRPSETVLDLIPRPQLLHLSRRRPEKNSGAAAQGAADLKTEPLGRDDLLESCS